MSKARHPRRGSMQFWPRKRSKHNLARVRSWADEKEAKALGFVVYKAGMTHLMVKDNRPKGLTKDEIIAIPVTILECPPMSVAGVMFYKNTSRGPRKVAAVISPNKVLAKKINLPKKQSKSIEDITEFDDLRLLVNTDPSKTSTGNKKPKVIEVAVGGSKEDKLAYAKEKFGKELLITDVMGPGNQVDLHGITKGKGFQGTVKRFGVPIRHHKSEKTKRGIGNLGAWTPKRVDYRVPQSGKMGFHLRTEYNKQVIKIGENGKDVTPTGGIINYGVVKGSYILLKGSVVGPKKGAVLLTKSIRPHAKITKEAPEISQISLHN